MFWVDWLWSLWSWARTTAVDPDSDSDTDTNSYFDSSDDEEEEPKMPLIIAVSGKLGTGKDYIIKNYILPTINGKVCKMAFADHIKVNVASQDPTVSLLECLEGFKDTILRKKLQTAGTEQGRAIYGPDIWVRTLENWIKLRQIRGDNIDVVLVTDCRFPNEAEWIKSNGGLLIRVRAPSRNRQALVFESDDDTEKMLSIMNHPSETSLDDFPFDYYIENEPSMRVTPQLQSIITHFLSDKPWLLKRFKPLYL